jgi:hypothetical protein
MHGSYNGERETRARDALASIEPIDVVHLDRPLPHEDVEQGS